MLAAREETTKQVEKEVTKLIDENSELKAELLLLKQNLNHSQKEVIELKEDLDRTKVQMKEQEFQSREAIKGYKDAFSVNGHFLLYIHIYI